MWVEREDQEQKTATMSDVSFRIECTALPVDHTAALAESICSQHAWIGKLATTGVHPIYVAGSQNGWQRPDAPDQLLLLSKRTRLRIRIDSSLVDDLIGALQGTRHSIKGHGLKILNGQRAPLKAATTLLSRYTVYLDDTEDAADEQALVNRVIGSCTKLGYSPNKILCGRSAIVATAEGPVLTRSVLLADVPVEYSLALQESGLGDYRLAGCGLLIPHKDTGAVS